MFFFLALKKAGAYVLPAGILRIAHLLHALGNPINTSHHLVRRLPIVAAIALMAMSAWVQRIDGANAYELQARAWLRGSLDVPRVAEDLSLVDGKWYVAFPPLPSVVLLPWVTVFGEQQVPLRTIAAGLALVIAWLVSRILLKLEAPAGLESWFIVAFIAGTALWQCVVLSNGTWFLAHVVAVLCSLAAIDAALNGRALAVGAFIGAAFLSRQLTLFLAPFVLVLLWQRLSDSGRRRSLQGFALALTAVAVCVAGQLAYNSARFGNPFDTGYGAMPLSGHLAARVAKYGLFHLAYAPFNFVHMFLQGPHIDFGGERLLRPIGQDAMGTSLILASPFVLLALWARTNRPLLIAAAVSIGAPLLAMLCYYNNGWVQLNAQRFTLDFLPVLFVLVVIGARSVAPIAVKALIAWSFLLNAVMLVLLPHASRWLGGL